jgi:hypothetical protein
LVERLPVVVTALGVDGAVEPRLEFELERRAGGDVALIVTCTADEPVEAGVRVELRLDRTDDPRWVVPGVFYGENRPENCKRIFPRFVPCRTDVEAMESDAWSFRADRCATPAVFARGGALVTTEQSVLGQSGVGFAYEDGRPVLRLHFPYREEPLRYDGSETPAPPDVRVHRWAPGESALLDFTVHELEDDAHAYAHVLRETAERAPRAADPGWVSIEEAAELAAWGLYRWHYRPDPPRLLETVAFDRDERADRDAMHVSWVSGVPYAYALLRHGRRVGNVEYVGAAEAVLDHIAGNLTPGGTFWSQWTASRGWTTGWHPDHTRLHARTLADATLFMLRAGSPWEQAARSNVAVACRTQRDDGALPAAHHVETGEAVAWEGTAGLAWIPALVEAGELDSARAAGDYYRRFVEAEFLYGAPEDVDLAPTSEDGYAALMAYVALEDVDTARRAADWMLSFRYTYDVSFSPQTILGHYRFRTRGGDQASPANQHLHAFGLICLPELVRLARATRDDYYYARARENLDCFRQFIAREDGDFDAYRGMATERYYQTDCFQAKGMLLTLSHAWSVGVLLYACEVALELPELA